MISSLKGSVGHYIETKLYEARIKRAIHLANLDVDRAFRLENSFPFGRAARFTGVGLMVLLMFGVISYAVTFSPDVSLKEVMVKSKPAVEKPATVIKAPPKKAEPVKETPKIVQASLVTTKTEKPVNGAGIDLLPDFSTLPRPEIDLSMPERVAPYVLVVDKSRGELLVLEENKDNFKIVKRYKTSLGSKRGDKLVRGDLRTPEGLYNIVSVKENRHLPPQYGPRAFVLNYPNKLDKKLGKTGDGIWIHGSGLGENIEATEGCVEVNDMNVVDLGKFADVGTQVYIFPEKFEVPVKNGAVQKDLVRPDTVYAIKRWWAGELKKREAGLLAEASRSSG
ncbi:hypothetical protein MNBD_NITROSPINAE02-1955 [hydrothermal vent metagenome]|uniref:L,D-TPase catalytic domain-containing protein n=1 Tax=hydrothermal vent metagenome TaxID=652676 RepID=A0A3B1CKN7_9ZZZZ